MIVLCLLRIAKIQSMVKWSSCLLVGMNVLFICLPKISTKCLPFTSVRASIFPQKAAGISMEFISY